jgi:hypothetical protein
MWRTAAIALGLVLTASSIARGQNLPKAETLIDKYIEATGGKASYDKCTNRVSFGTMEIKPAGLKGKLTLYQAAPNKTYLEAEIAGLGKIEDSTDGKIVWERNPISGPRVKTGEEKASGLGNAVFNSEVNWQKVYKKAQTVGEEMVDGKACYKVEMITPEGVVRTHFFDKSTNLIVKLVSTEKTQLGNVQAESWISDYKKVDGILLPHKVRQKILTQEVVMAFDKIEHNVKLPDNRFEVPEEIKKLADKEKK